MSERRESIRLLVVDDDVPTRIGLRTIFDTEPDIDVVGEAADGIEACQLAEALDPDVVLMDIRLPRRDGFAATARIIASDRAGGSVPRVVVLTTFDDSASVSRALAAGASAVLLKRVPAEELVAAVRSVAALPPESRTPASSSIAGSDGSVEPSHAELVARLTSRERDVLILIAQGHSNDEIARALTISRDTVKTHVKRIFMKMGIHDRGRAIVAAYESGLVRPGQEPGLPGPDAGEPAFDGPPGDEITPPERSFSGDLR
jgi:DNA-binding NarL/FixJ family response regulator